MKNNISIVLLCTLPDPGIKSLGSKCLIPINKKPLIQHQIETINSALNGSSYEIVVSLYFDAYKVAKTINSFTKNAKIIKHPETLNNINFGGALFDCLSHTQYDNVLFINYGCLYTKNTIKKFVTSSIKDNIIGITNSKILENINLSCHIDNDNITNIFFNLNNYKYTDMVFLNAETKKFMQSYFSTTNTMNKFTFELINATIEQGYNFKPILLNDQDYIFINNLKTLNKSKRILNNATTKTK